jgi:NADH-quinone oxidoreductase subunit B
MGIEAALPVDGILTTQFQRLVNWARRSAVWPMPFATACCGIELMATASSRYDLARFGAEVMRFSPRQADLLIVAGRVAVKMLPVLQRIYVQMTEPKWVISMGACASTGGVFDTYAVVQGVDQFIPVDVYVPGCPPRPEQLIEGIMAITGCFVMSLHRRAGRKLIYLNEVVDRMFNIQSTTRNWNTIQAIVKALTRA